MKTPREPREVTIDERCHTEPRKAGLFRDRTITDYVSTHGMVREILSSKKKPEYILLDTGEPVNVQFYGDISKEELYLYKDPEIFE